MVKHPSVFWHQRNLVCLVHATLSYDKEANTIYQKSIRLFNFQDEDLKDLRMNKHIHLFL